MNKAKTSQKAEEAPKDLMSPAARKARASKAAHARWKRDSDGVALATHEGSWMGIPCAVLKDGRRVFSERGMSAALQHIRSGSEYKKMRRQKQGEKLPVFITPTLAQFLPEPVKKKLSDPIRYRRIEGRLNRGNFSIPAKGVEAELLPEICEAYMKARDANLLDSEADRRRAMAAEHLMRALAKTGIVALIDEVTGYQEERDRDELQQLLNKYVAPEFRPYSAVFPSEFYKQMFRLRDVTTDDVRKRPAYFGRLTNQVVYERLLPGVLDRLREVNPLKKGRGRPRRHHQHLTEDQGIQHLRGHLTGVVFLMKASPNWQSFMAALDKAAPVQAVQDELK